MWESVSENLLEPLLRRLGTLLAGVLVTAGFESGQSHQLSSGLVAVGLVAIDLYRSRRNTRKLKGKS